MISTRLAALLVAAVFGVTFGVAAAGANTYGPAGPVVDASPGPSPFNGCTADDPAGQMALLGGHINANSEVEPRIDINPVHPLNLVGVQQQDRWSDPAGGARGNVASVSQDGGAHWNQVVLPGVSKCFGGIYDRATDPWVSFAPNGDVFASSLGYDVFDAANGVLVSKSVNGGNSWTTTSVLADTYTGAVDDKESITADPYTPGNVYVTWDRTIAPPSGTAADQAVFHATAYRQQAWFARTTNGGASWEPAREIYNPGTQAGTVGNIIVVLPNGDLVDGFVAFADHKQKLSYNVAVVRSTDKGATWSKTAISVASLDPTFLAPFDPDNGHFIRSGELPDFAAAPAGGKLYAVWEDDSPNPGIDAIQFSQSTDGGQTWSTPVKINQTPTNIPPEDQQAFTPTVKVAADGTVGVTYYDLRENTPDPGLPTDYWLIHCHAGCTNPAHWAESQVAGPFDMTQAPTVGTHGTTFLGDYAGMATFGNNFVPYFVQAGNPADPSDVYSTTLSPQP